MTTASDFLKELNQKRRKYVDGVKVNGFEEGILSFLSDLYPDQAHFIYELLQNAEDAGATRVRFRLGTDLLQVVHNGKRKFDQRDVDSIAGIGQSTKKDDINQIGKFGVGFKAVFSYSPNPQIFSGDFNFQIDDLVCPIEIEPIRREPEETVFIFPLGTARKSAKECFKEISEGLAKLDHTAVLFLNNVSLIEWKIEDHRWTSVSRREPVDGVTEITRSGEPPLYFLRYQMQLPKHGDLQCGIAFKLSFRSEKQTVLKNDQSLSDQIRFDAIPGKLCIFFAAEKEATGLKFHVNGPFASTIDRASIPHDNKDNQSIIAAAAKLLCEAMHDIKARGLLSIDLLEVLPNQQDDLPTFYDALRSQVVDEMRNRDLVPTKMRGHARSINLVRGPKTVSDVISGEDLEFLTGSKSGWAFNALQSGRADKFLASLGIPEWSFGDLIAAMDEKCYWTQGEEWLAEKQDAWMQEFYLLLLTAVKRADQEQKLHNWSVLRTNEHRHLKTAWNEVYFPSEGSPAASEFITLKDTLLSNVTKDVKQRLREFFTAAGVKELGEREEILVILNSFYAEDPPLQLTERQHLAHMRHFVKWMQEHRETDFFKGRLLFWDSQKNRQGGPDCYLDRPLKKTNLALLYDEQRGGTGSRSPLWKGYVSVKGFMEFAASLGVAEHLIFWTVETEHHPMKKELQQGYGRWTSNGIDEDFEAEEQKHILTGKNPGLSRLLWQAMCDANSDWFTAKFRPNQRFDIRTAPSSLILGLRGEAWIPSKDGQFHRPCEMTRSQLRYGFDYNDANGWLTAIGFGENEKKLNEESKRKALLAKELGISVEDIDFVKDLKQNPEYYKRFRTELQTSKFASSFPQRPVHDPQRRKDKMRTKLDAAASKQYEERSRSVRISKSEVDAQTWLREQYRNDEDEVICQICSKVMPFKKRNGKYYLEAIAVSSLIDKEIEAAFLALCPLCAAKYMEFIRRDSKAELAVVQQILSCPQQELEIELGAEKGILRFVEAHWEDLKTIIEQLNPQEKNGPQRGTQHP